MAVTWTKSGTTYTLTDNTLLSDLLAEGPIANNDTVSLNSFTLTIDDNNNGKAIKPTGSGIINFLTNGFLSYSADIPNTIHIIMGTQENPLPANGNINIDTSSTGHNCCYNACAAIWSTGNCQILGKFDIYTEKRDSESYSMFENFPSANQIKIKDNINILPGDGINIGVTPTKFRVESYNPETKIITLTTNHNQQNYTNQYKGRPIICVGGGIAISTGNGPICYPSCPHGVIQALGNTRIEAYDLNEVTYIDKIFSSYALIQNRGILKINEYIRYFSYGAMQCNVANTIIDKFIFNSNVNLLNLSNFSNIKINNLFCCYGLFENNNSYLPYEAFLNNVYTYSNTIGSFNIGYPKINKVIHVKNWKVLNSNYEYVSQFDTDFTPYGTITKIPRSSFSSQSHSIPDTDLSDVYYHKPTTSSDTTWRHEDMLVRNGETLRLNARAMLGSSTSVARFAVGEIGIWCPAEGMSTLAEWKLANVTPLEWHGGTLEWTNNTGEDKQVRVWEMVSGVGGAYTRVWEAIGGIL